MEGGGVGSTHCVGDHVLAPLVAGRPAAAAHGLAAHEGRQSPHGEARRRGGTHGALRVDDVQQHALPGDVLRAACPGRPHPEGHRRQGVAQYCLQLRGTLRKDKTEGDTSDGKD